MKNGSLENIISDMVRRLDAVQPDHEQKGSADPLAEIAGFMHADPVLACLHKQYIEANTQHKKLVYQNGRDDPMAEVAADMLDSARSAVQTRLLELQEERDEETTEAMYRSLRMQQADEEIKIARHEMKKRQRDKEGDLFFWLLAFFWLMNRTMIATRKTLSAANDFALVSNMSVKRKSYAN